MPAGNQIEVVAAARREHLTTAEIHAVVDLIVACASRPQMDFILQQPRRALRQAQIESLPAWDPRLSAAGNRVLRQLGGVLSGLGQMRLDRADYEAQLAQRRYEQVDPSNRLVAASLEQRWNDALSHLEDIQREFVDFQRSHGLAVTKEQRTEILALARNLPRLWNASTTSARDKKRLLRLLIKDITVERFDEPRQFVLHVRWQGKACEDLRVDRRQPMADRLRYLGKLYRKSVNWRRSKPMPRSPPLSTGRGGTVQKESRSQHR